MIKITSLPASWRRYDPSKKNQLTFAFLSFLWLWSGHVVWWLGMRTHNTWVFSSVPICVTMITPLVRKATGNYLMKSTSLENVRVMSLVSATLEIEYAMQARFRLRCHTWFNNCRNQKQGFESFSTLGFYEGVFMNDVKAFCILQIVLNFEGSGNLRHVSDVLF